MGGSKQIIQIILSGSLFHSEFDLLVALSRVEVVAPGVGLDKGYSGLLDFFVGALEIRIDRLQSDWTLEEGGLIKIAIFFLLLGNSLFLVFEVSVDRRLLVCHATL